MSMSNYPNGFRYGLTVRNQPILNTHSGNIFWVGKTPEGQAGSNGYDGTYNWPFATIDFAIGKCTANHGDVIVVKAGHTESLTTASAITCDVAGVAIVGLGGGADRPTITFASTDNSASIVISAASVSIENIIGTTSDDGLTNPFHVQAADCWLDIEWRDASSTVEAACVVLTTQAADNLHVNLEYHGFTAGNACVTPINLIGVDNADITVNFFGEASTAVVNMGGTTASSNVTVRGFFHNDNVALTKNVVDTVTGSTWFASGYDGKGGYSFSGGSAAALAADDVSTVVSNQAVATANTSTNALERDVVGNKTDAAVNAVTTTKSLMGYLKGVLNEVTVATANTSANGFMNDVIGNKTDTAQNAVNTSRSAMMYLKGIVNEITVATANTSANGFMNDVIGNKTDTAQNAVNTSRSAMMYLKGIVNEITVAAANTSANGFMNDVIGNKTDTAQNTVNTSRSAMMYLKGIVNEMAVPVADTSDNAFINDVIGNKTDAAIKVVGTTNSLMGYMKNLVNAALDGPTATYPNYFAVTALFTSATWATTANTHEVITVTGLNRIRMLARCSGNIGGNVGLLVSLGTSASTTAFIGATTATMIDNGELWISSTTNSNVAYINYNGLLDHIVNGQDVGYRLWNHASGATAGSLIFHVWWEPLSSGATCAAGAGGTLA